LPSAAHAFRHAFRHQFRHRRDRRRDLGRFSPGGLASVSLAHGAHVVDLEKQLSRVALAVGIGLLLGRERGWRLRKKRGPLTMLLSRFSLRSTV
jgi:hypothetical protein